MAGTSYKGSDIKSVDQFIKDKAGLSSSREKEIGQHIGYRYDVNLIPDYERITPFLKGYMEFMGWDDLNWLREQWSGPIARALRSMRVRSPSTTRACSPVCRATSTRMRCS